MTLRVVVLGAGFGGLELSTMLSEALADRLDLTLIDKSASFFFGYSKLDVMFGREKPGAVRLAYRNIAKPAVRFRQEAISAIDPQARRVTTNKGTCDADVLLIALGADYDHAATPGLIEGGNEFYSLAGAAACYIEFGTGRVGRVDVNFLSGPAPTGSFTEPSVALVGEKQHVGSSRRARWFGL